MALGKPKSGYQREMFVSTDAICSSADPYCRVLDQLLVESGFDAFLAEVCREFYHKNLGRPSLPPGVTSGC